jgi:hypothetical protein
MNELDSWKVLAGIKHQTTSSAPDGSNISITANDKARIMREQNIKPGTDAWFKLWFSKPYLTGERPT